MINPNKLGRSPFPAHASQWMLVGLRGGTAPPVGLNDGDAVSSWLDSSGNGHTATQAGAARPTFKSNIINGKPVVRFVAASSQYLSFPTIAGDAPWTVFAVVRKTTPTNIMQVMGGSPGAAPGLTLYNDNNVYVQDKAYFLVGTQSAPTAFHVITGQTAGGGFGNIWQDGVSILSGPSTAFSRSIDLIHIGRADTSYSDGDIAEIIFYVGAFVLRGTDRENIEKYLGTKYAISVPAGIVVDPATVFGLVAWWKADSLGT